MAAVAASALFTLIAMSVHNPEQEVARGHLELFRGEAVDQWYLIHDLGADAVPTTLADPDTRSHSCSAEIDAEGWLAWNLSRSRAQDALDRYCS
ncbi:MAG: hypothetical protein GY698_07530 [Actinomycetia bacterium]|nr:hypothetical protein [Actinomycetes bacterium]